MPSERKYFVICEDNCKFEGMTKEQILSAIAQAVSTGEITDINSGIVSKIRETNKNKNIQFWLGTQAEYNAISSPDENVMYIISDDRSKEELETALEELQRAVASFGTAFDGVSSAVSNLGGSVASLDADTDTMQESLSALADDISEAQTDIQTIQGTIETQGASISGLVDDVAEVAEIDDLITGDSKVTLFSGDVSPTARTIQLSQAVTSFSKLSLTVETGETASTKDFYRSIIGSDKYVFEFYTQGEGVYNIYYLIFHFNGAEFIIDYSTAPSDDVTLSIVGIL